MDVMRDEKLPERAARSRVTPSSKCACKSWAGEHDLVGDVRVVGAMAGMELVRDRGTKEPADKKETAESPGCRARERSYSAAEPVRITTSSAR